jgi:hypothetical protein
MAENASAHSMNYEWRRLGRESAARSGALGRLDVVVADVGIQTPGAPFASYRVKI